MFIGVLEWYKMSFRNTLVAHKYLINPYLIGFVVLQEIICGTFGNMENGLFAGFQELWVLLKSA